MSGAFRDIYLPPAVKGYPTSGAPRFSTAIVRAFNGGEHRNQNWAHPLHRYNLAEAVRDHETYTALAKHWFAMRGPFYDFPFLDPLDFASADLPAANHAPTVTGFDQVLGQGDDETAEFQLVKAYTATGLDEETYSRPIYLPRVSTVLVGLRRLDGDPTHAWLAGDVPDLYGGARLYSVTRPGGKVVFEEPLGEEWEVTAGFLFDVRVRYESDDSFEGIVRNYRVSGFADLTLIEQRPC